MQQTTINSLLKKNSDSSSNRLGDIFVCELTTRANQLELDRNIGRD